VQPIKNKSAMTAQRIHMSSDERNQKAANNDEQKGKIQVQRKYTGRKCEHSSIEHINNKSGSGVCAVMKPIQHGETHR